MRPGIPKSEPALAPLLEILPMERLMVAVVERWGLVPGAIAIKVTRQE
jgi:hypothetical protein